MSSDEDWKALGEMKLSELDPYAADLLMELLFDRLDELDEEIEYYQALPKERPKENFPHTCHKRKYKRANVRNHADEERSDPEDISSDA